MRTAWVDGLANVITVSRRHIFNALTTGGGTDEIEEATGTPVTIEDDGAVHCVPGSTGWGRATDLAGHVYFYRSISSTNDRLRELAARGVPQGTIVVTEEQTAGRGRHGRGWYSPPGAGLYSSLLLWPTIGVDRVGWITLAAALALVRVAKEEGIGLRIKWPNDVEYDGKKVAGILAETVLEGDRVEEVVLGTGINVSWEVDKVPEEIRMRGTALSLCAPVTPDRDRFLASYLWELWGIVGELESEKGNGAPAVASEMMAHLTYLGEHVRIETSEGEQSGICTGLTEEGYLQLDGGLRVVSGELIINVENGD